MAELDPNITSGDLDMMIEEIDSDGSGTVDFDGQYVNLYYTYILYRDEKRPLIFMSSRNEVG